jgi:vacuolar iron transporter family protein
MLTETGKFMPTTPHIERHFTSSETVRDVVIGMSDGLTVPFALAAGISGAVHGTNIVVTAGLSEIAAGSIAMGLGGYLAARSDAEHYAAEKQREEREIVEMPAQEKAEIAGIFRNYGLNDETITQVVSALSGKPRQWIDFMMKEELGLDQPDPTRARQSALTIGFSYIAGGLIPLSPYILFKTVSVALPISVLVTFLALFIFGAIKGRFTGVHPVRSGLQTLLVGGLAAAVAFGLARLLG